MSVKNEDELVIISFAEVRTGMVIYFKEQGSYSMLVTEVEADGKYIKVWNDRGVTHRLGLEYNRWFYIHGDTFFENY